jgi:hypothetical protein
MNSNVLSPKFRHFFIVLAIFLAFAFVIVLLAVIQVTPNPTAA